MFEHVVFVILEPWCVLLVSITSLIYFFFAANHNFTIRSRLILGDSTRQKWSIEIIDVKPFNEVVHFLEHLVTFIDVFSGGLVNIKCVVDAILIVVISERLWSNKLEISQGLGKRWISLKEPVGASVSYEEACQVVGGQRSVPLSLQIVLVDLP